METHWWRVALVKKSLLNYLRVWLHMGKNCTLIGFSMFELDFLEVDYMTHMKMLDFFCLGSMVEREIFHSPARGSFILNSL